MMEWWQVAENAFQQFGVAVFCIVASNRATIWYYKHFRKIDLKGGST